MSLSYFPLLLIMLAAVFNALMDVSSEDRFKRSYWKFKKDWLNKTTGSNYKYLDNDPRKGPKFPGSTTMLVWMTDGWHLFQFLFHSCWQIAYASIFGLVWWKTIFLVLGIKTLFSGLFTIIYQFLKRRL